MQHVGVVHPIVQLQEKERSNTRMGVQDVTFFFLPGTRPVTTGAKQVGL